MKDIINEHKLINQLKIIQFRAKLLMMKALMTKNQKKSCKRTTK